MNFDFSDEQKFLKEEARKLLAGTCTPAVVRKILDDADSSYDRELWRTIADLGWLGLTIPEDYGGLGMARVDLCAVAEELGRALAPLPVSSSLYLFTEALMFAGSPDQRARLLPDVASGAAIGCIALSEGPGDQPPQASVSNNRLTGVKLPVTDGDSADHAIVSACEDGVTGLYIVDLSSDGVGRRSLRTLDPTRSAAEIRFDNVVVERLGEAGQGDSLLASILDRGAVYLAFEQVGGATRAMEMARDYALERYAFGRPIGSFQAIKHRLADMFIRIELARSHAYFGAWALQQDATTLARAASAARIAACDAFWFVSKEAIEIFGGIGSTWEADAHLYYRRAKQLAVEVGGPVRWRERLAATLEQDFRKI